MINAKTFLVGLMLAVVAAPSLAESKGKTLQRADYGLWHRMFVGSVSPDGKYLSYTLQYPGSDKTPATIDHVVVDIATGRDVVKVPGTTVPDGRYSADGRWYAMPGADGTRLLDLVSAEARVFQGHSRFDFNAQSEYFIILERDADPDAATGKLFVVGLKGGAGLEMSGVSSFALGQDGKTLRIVQRSGDAWVLKLLELGAPLGTEAVLMTSAGTLDLLATGDERSSLLVQEVPANAGGQGVGTVTHYFEPLENGPGYRHYRHGHGRGSSRVWGHEWHASSHGPFIVFSEKSLSERQGDSSSSNADFTADVQVWHSRDARVVSDRKRATATRQFAWWPRSGALVEVAGERSSMLFVTSDGAYAVTQAEGLDIRTSWDNTSGRHELVDLVTGKRTVLFEGGEGRALQGMTSSPDGRYLAYVADARWWIHDLRSGVRRELAVLVDAPLFVEDWDFAGHVPPHGSPGWTADNELILYDRYDVWLVSPGATSAKRITDGRATARVYRVDRAANGVGPRKSRLDVSRRIVFSVFNEVTKQSGYSVYESDAGLTDLVYEDAHIERVLPRPGGGFVHTRQRFDTPPQLVAVGAGGSTERVLYRSNAHHVDFGLGQAKLIQYEGKSGKRLQGVLLYPAGYEEGKTYPMIVSIYQRQSKRLHEYQIPSRSEYMPYANYTGDGYFVLLPDIEYGTDGPGEWAVQAVEAAVEAALKVGRIDRKAIGLTGASWGGYQTLYIAGNSDLFATAVAGSAPADLVSNYLSVEPGAGIPTIWRYETQQLRMHHPLHEGHQNYVRNSPIFHASKISMPILSWHGEKDDLIASSQAIEMHLLLRRMKRQHVLLMYPGEGHVLTTRDKAIDLNARMKQWFDHYLKGVAAPDWILRGDGLAGDIAGAVR